MKIKVKKEKKEENYTLIDSWDEVTLEKWMKFINFNEKGSASEAVETLTSLSDMPKNVVESLGINDVANLMNHLSNLQASPKSKLKKVFEIDGIEYGMHPDLSSLTLGEYADIETFLKQGIEKNMPKIMAILFRPVISKENEAYTIEAYDGDINIRAEIMKKMSSVQVQQALVFFYHLGTVLLRTLPSSLMAQVKRVKRQIEMRTLPASGVGLA